MNWFAATNFRDWRYLKHTRDIKGLVHSKKYSQWGGSYKLPKNFGMWIKVDLQHIHNKPRTKRCTVEHSHCDSYTTNKFGHKCIITVNLNEILNVKRALKSGANDYVKSKWWVMLAWVTTYNLICINWPRVQCDKYSQETLQILPTCAVFTSEPGIADRC